ncbi:MAG: aminomethyl-transferring glycine dehydrogenase subunit GcvPA [Planctomycetes bacterium]|nr:aminomethyl-transferring glycine dehydrogenase subunit GcvPA [Planctomycetota bacterium]
MLAAIGCKSVDDLMAVIPEDCRFVGELDVEPALTEDELVRHVRALTASNVSADGHPCFLGAGAYRHFCPSLVDSLVARTEFWTAYTPYQPEASQGTLTTILEWQTMMCRLTGMEVSNASLYDGATAVVEAVLMALRVKSKATRVVVSEGVHPDAIGCLKTYLKCLDVELVTVPLVDGASDAPALAQAATDGTAAVVVQSPNFFGVVEELQPLVDAAHAHGALSVVAADPVSLGVLEPPGAFGADMVCGEATGMGNPPWFGGPGVGYLCARSENVRQMPARIAGETVDAQGRRAVVLTFQTREQHIRRSKATSNICTSQQLMALRATIWMALLGKQGFVELSEVNLARAHHAAARIAKIPGYGLAHAKRAFFNEFTVTTPIAARDVNRRLLDEHGILGGYDLGQVDPSRSKQLLLAVTDSNPADEIDALVAALETIR